MSDGSGSALWALRVASSPQDGGGHVRRCLALAAELSESVAVRFVLDSGSMWSAFVQERGFPVVSESDSDRWTAIVLDGYRFGSADFGRWRRRAAFLALIDDLGSDPPDVDFLIRPGSGHRLDRRVAAGLDYALLERRYASAPVAPPARSKQHVLVSFGLRDSANATGLVLGALGLMAADGMPETTVLLGADAPHRAQVAAAAAGLGNHVRLRTDVMDVMPLLCDADVVVGAGGVGLLECMACGVPSLTISTSANQEGNAAEAAASGGTQWLGPVRACTAASVALALRALLNESAARTRMRQQARAAVDGAGAARAAAALLAAAQRTHGVEARGS